MLKVRLLGQFSVELDDEAVDIPSRPAQSLLAYLILNAGIAQRRERVAGLLWPESTEANARSNLRHALWRLRKALGESLQTGRDYFDADDITIAFNATADYWLDTAVLDRKADESWSADELIEAVSAYQGELLPGFYDDWVTLERERLQAVFEHKMQLLLERLVEAGRWSEVLAWGERWIALGHTPEPAYRALMVAHSGLGDLSSVAAVYQRCVEALHEELGVEPSQKTKDLYEHIIAGEFRAGVVERRERVIRGYEVRERIGAGGFGVVYRAYQPAVGRDVAIKVILPEYANHPDFIRRFEAEAQLVARLEHLHIVPLYDYWREPDGAYLVMRWLRGGNLRGSLQRGPWAPEAAARLLDQVAGALAVAHRQGVVHRDVKPENILLDEEGNGYLSDFGIAKDLIQTTGVTGTGAVVGSPAYVSPEQAQGRSITPQSDLYSLGVVMYQVLTGEHPFPGVTPAEQLVKHLTEPLPPLRERRPELPETLEEVMRRATAKDPADRFPETPAFARAFREAISGVAVEAVAPPPDWIPLEMVNPYKGLRAFEEADAADFFGREALTEQLLARLREDEEATRFLAVVGPSGSGKSSVVKAGLIPALRQGALPGSEDWLIVEMFPGAHPLEELEAALLRVAVNPPPSLIEQLKDEHGLLRAVKRTLPPGDFDLLLVIDQFEELFTLVDDEAVRRHLMGSLLAAVADPRSRLRVVVTLRADFYDRPLRYAEFGELLCANMETVMPLSSAELEQAICGPAERVGANLEGGLLAAIVAEVNEQPGALPMLQYALTELFERREGPLLTREAYQAVGGVSGALARRAEEVYTELDEAAQKAARQLFLRLITLGEGVEDTRRRVLRSELMAMQTPGVTEAPRVLEAVIEAFDRSRLLLFDRDPATRAPTVEVAHEALLREWLRLRRWLDESRADVRLQRILGNAAAEWLQAERDPSFLLRGARLDQLEGWAQETDLALTEIERAYLDASLEDRRQREAEEEARRQREAALEQRARRVLQGLVGVLLAAAIISGGLAIYALIQRQAALRQASIGLASQALLELEGTSPERSVPLALEALENYPYTWQAERALGQAVLGSPLHLILQHGPSVNSARWSPDGTRILTASDDGTAKVWDASSGEELLTLTGHEDVVLSAEWSPAGDRLVTASADGTGRVWNAIAGEELLKLLCPYGCTVAVWAPTGKLIATGGVEGADGRRDSRTWDATTGEELATLGHFNVSRSLYKGELWWSPDGSRIACASGSQIRVWDAVIGKTLLTLTGHRDIADQIAWSPDGLHIVSTSWDGTAKVWDAATGEELLTFTGHTDEVYDAAWSPDGSRIVSGSLDNTAKVWDVSTALNTGAATAEELFVFHHSGWVELVAWSPDGSRIATSGEDDTIKVWDAGTGTELFTLFAQGVVDIAWSPSSDRLLVASHDGTAKIWDLASTLLTLPGREMQSFGREAWSIRAAWSPTGDHVARGYEDGTVKVWDISTALNTGAGTGEEMVILSGHTETVCDIEWSPSGDRIATGGWDTRIKVWDATSGIELYTLPLRTSAFDEALVVKWSPDGRRIANASWTGLPRVWDLDTGTDHLSLLGHFGPVHDITWSPDGTRIATAGLEDGTAKVWDAVTGQVIRDLYPEGSESSVRSVAWSPDGTRIATSGLSGCRIWDAGSGEELLTFGVDAFISWSHTGDRILGGSADGIARVWDADTGAELMRYDMGSPGTATWSPDGKHIATASLDGALKVFPAWQSTEDLIDYAKECCVVRELTAEEREQFGLPLR